jgi:hypothetical protein
MNGLVFFLTIVDDCTRFTWVHLMQSKSQTKSIIQAFFNLAQTQFKTKIKCLRSDNGLEFKMNDFFAAQSTIHQLNCVETPQQNVVVERKHQHLLNVARSLRFQSHLPMKFWEDCIFTATHLINIIPTPLLSKKSPYELLYSAIPFYNHLKVFGCLAYVSTLSRNKVKFDHRATPSIFIGYPYGMKGYKFYNLHTHFAIISRHAVFHESIFPYASNFDHSSTPIHEDVTPSIHIVVLDILEEVISILVFVSDSSYHHSPISETPIFEIPIPNESFLETFIPAHELVPHFQFVYETSISPIPCPPPRKSTKIKSKPSYL